MVGDSGGRPDLVDAPSGWLGRRGREWTSRAGIDVDYDVEMPTQDGTVLRADVYRSTASAQPRPVLLVRTPYDKTHAHMATYFHPAWYARQGFIVVIQDVRGRFASEGRFDPFLNEGTDGFDAVEWSAVLEGSNGRVGMYGASYIGAVQLLAAAQNPPHLRAIAPAVTNADFRTWMYEAGALNLGFAATWSLFLAHNGANRQGDSAEARRLVRLAGRSPEWLMHGPPSELADILGPYTPFFKEWINDSVQAPIWDRLHGEADLETIRIPTLHITGWYDIFLSGALRAFEGSSDGDDASSQHMVIGPWAHYPWGDQLGRDANGTGRIDLLQVDFFRRYLSDGATDDQSSVKYYVLFEGWRGSDSWPPEPSRTGQLFLRSQGSANTRWGDGRLDRVPPSDPEPCDFYQYYSPAPVAAVGGNSCCDPGIVPMGCLNQSSVEQLPDVLIYTTEAASRDMIVAGPIDLQLYVVTDAESADYFARLCLVNKDGSWNVAEGIRRLDAEELQEARAGDGVAPVHISLRDTAVRVREGEWLRLQITGGSFPTFDVNPQTGESPLTTPSWEGRGALHAVLHEPRYLSVLQFREVNESEVDSISNRPGSQTSTV